MRASFARTCTSAGASSASLSRTIATAFSPASGPSPYRSLSGLPIIS